MRGTSIAKGLNAPVYNADDVPFMRMRREAVFDVSGVKEIET